MQSSSPLSFLSDKEKLIAEARRRFIGPIFRRILRDGHARRRPRPCGLTVHVALNCPFACTYCYIEDMGFKFQQPSRYPLSSLETMYAIALNPYFIPGKMGTFIAIGSVSEPFHPAIYENTLSLIHLINEKLGNPIQFSTKMHLNEEIISKLSEQTKGGSISPLITIITLKYHDKLEPRTPPPEKRLETIEKLSKRGFKPALFLRPIIPEIIEEEIDDLLEKAYEHGAYSVVVGSLRVSNKIIDRLMKAGINVTPIIERINKPLKAGEQFTIETSREKKLIREKDEKLGLIYLQSACCANALSAGVPCCSLCFTSKMCTKCLNNCPSKLPKADEESVQEVIRFLTFKLVDVEVKGFDIYVYGRFSRKKRLQIKVVLSTIFRRRVHFP